MKKTIFFTTLILIINISRMFSADTIYIHTGGIDSENDIKIPRKLLSHMDSEGVYIHTGGIDSEK